MTPPPHGDGGRATINVQVNLDGRKVSSGVTQHQGRMASGPSHGG